MFLYVPVYLLEQHQDMGNVVIDISIYLDAGHIAENLALTVASLNLGCCHIAAFFDDEINRIVKIDGKNESSI